MVVLLDMGLTSTYDISRLNFESVVPSWVPKVTHAVKLLCPPLPPSLQIAVSSPITFVTSRKYTP